MELKFTIARIYRKAKYNQVFGNHIQLLHPRSGVHNCTGSTPVLNLIPGLKVKEGIIPVIVRIEDQPFEGATHQMWVYGAPYTRRLSAERPDYEGCDRGHIRAVGDAYLDIWCDHEYFGNHAPGSVFQVWLSARRFDPSSLADANIPEA